MSDPTFPSAHADDEPDDRSGSLPFLVVGIGASAGGLRHNDVDSRLPLDAIAPVLVRLSQVGARGPARSRGHFPC